MGLRGRICQRVCELVESFCAKSVAGFPKSPVPNVEGREEMWSSTPLFLFFIIDTSFILGLNFSGFLLIVQKFCLHRYFEKSHWCGMFFEQQR